MMMMMMMFVVLMVAMSRMTTELLLLIITMMVYYDNKLIMGVLESLIILRVIAMLAMLRVMTDSSVVEDSDVLMLKIVLLKVGMIKYNDNSGDNDNRHLRVYENRHGDVNDDDNDNGKDAEF